MVFKQFMIYTLKYLSERVSKLSLITHSVVKSNSPRDLNILFLIRQFKKNAKTQVYIIDIDVHCNVGNMVITYSSSAVLMFKVIAMLQVLKIFDE